MRIVLNLMSIAMFVVALPNLGHAQLTPSEEAYNAILDGNIQRGFEIAVAACDTGDGESCWVAAHNVRFDGEAHFEAKDRREKYYKLACETGIPEGCLNYGAELSRFKFSSDKDDPKFIEAREYYELGCIGEIARSCFNLGLMQLEGVGGDSDLVKARKNFGIACEPDDLTKACKLYAQMLSKGEGGDVDLPKAREVFAMVCESLNELDTCNGYALNLIDEKAGPVAIAKAVEIFEENCLSALGAAYLAHGKLLETGRGLTQDTLLAHSKYREACDYGDAEGCFTLAQFKMKTLNTEVASDDIRTALNFSCEGNFVEGCVAYAEYLKVSPVPGATDVVTAYSIKRTYRKACELGRQDVCELSE